MQLIEFGGTKRIVLFIGPWALKIPRLRNWKNGLKANRYQAKLWEKGCAEGWSQLCPVRFNVGNGLCLVMARARPMSYEEFKTQFPSFEQWDAWMYVGGIKGLPGEYKPSTYGWINGQVVIVDYEDGSETLPGWPE